MAEDVLLTFISQTGSPRFVCSTGIIHNKSIISFPLQSGQHCSRLNAGLPMPWPVSSFTSAGAIICPSALAAALRFAACHYSPMLTIRIVAKSNLWNGFDFLESSSKQEQLIRLRKKLTRVCLSAINSSHSFGMLNAARDRSKPTAKAQSRRAQLSFPSRRCCVPFARKNDAVQERLLRSYHTVSYFSCVNLNAADNVCRRK